jgi:hypothetical protein
MRDAAFAGLLGAALGWLLASGSEKAPEVRILDVFLVGPWGLYLAMQRRPLTTGERWAVAFVAGATVTYNGRTYLRALERPTSPEATP